MRPGSARNLLSPHLDAPRSTQHSYRAQASRPPTAGPRRRSISICTSTSPRPRALGCLTKASEVSEPVGPSIVITDAPTAAAKSASRGEERISVCGLAKILQPTPHLTSMAVASRRASPRELVAELLRSTTCYDALPSSGKVSCRRERALAAGPPHHPTPTRGLGPTATSSTFPARTDRCL